MEKNAANYHEAFGKGEPFALDSAILVLSLIRGVGFSVISGFLAASIAKENMITAALLAVVLLIVGVIMHFLAWNYLPLWYHLLFLTMLIPMTLLGGKLKKI